MQSHSQGCVKSEHGAREPSSSHRAETMCGAARCVFAPSVLASHALRKSQPISCLSSKRNEERRGQAASALRSGPSVLYHCMPKRGSGMVQIAQGRLWAGLHPCADSDTQSQAWPGNMFRFQLC
ncbi:hypothetical protein SKAU_G00236600 [Synaphobranchus kaupii]|uniref:Uncharacterized protein n=1 Tax=Synaphobranchus kaupii TaxID=118154 RepID=A0A9Q1F748_SYNKA|nr:hypothetical protein SKAU_G00236600 [Synaphobranchus kaupii]